MQGKYGSCASGQIITAAPFYEWRVAGILMISNWSRVFQVYWHSEVMMPNHNFCFSLNRMRTRDMNTVVP